MKVYVLQHESDEDAEYDDVKFIGVYSSPDFAYQAIDRLSRLPGFSAARSGFHVDEYDLDIDHWTEGFVNPHSEAIE